MDPWEQFLPTVSVSMPSLAVLDDRCRCSICKDYLQGPMMTLCGHTFCSICIRRALNADGRCPVCRSLEEESKLRKNLMIEEIVEAYLPFRTSLMKYAPAESSNDVSPSAMTNGEHDVEVIDSESESPLSDPPSSPAASRKSSRVTRASRGREELAKTTTNEAPSLPPGHIQCPICQAPIHQDKAEYHVNRCLEGKATPPPASHHDSAKGQQSRYFNDTNNNQKPRAQTTPDRPSTPTANGMKRMPKMSYAAMNDAKLRKTMVDMGINSSGSRAQLQRRCTEFIAMWNSNLDSRHPKTKRQLINDMRAWDRIQAKPVQRATNEEIDAANESGKYDDSFNDLIVKARDSLKKRKALEREASGDKKNDVETDRDRATKRQHTEH